MLRLLLPLLCAGLFSVGVYYLYRAFTSVEFVYVRFRDGVLTLNKKGLFSSEEVEFKPGTQFEQLDAGQLVTLADKLDWYEFPSGHLIEAKSPEHQAITRTLRFAHNTNLLEAELDT